MIPVVSFIGHHNAGKTQLLTRLVETLTERGLKVGTVKHAPHLTVSDSPGSDSQLLRQSGAHRMLLLDSYSAVMTWPQSSIGDLEVELQKLFSDCDIVLIEGLKHGPFPKIEVFRRTNQVTQEPLAGDIDVIAVVSDSAIALPDGTPTFSPRNRAAIADYLEQRFLST
ncbi:molybdopterin-guanine dinucleotide biosynthesis protein B [Candidatus Bipolaricaulota bacterium]|nr:molybdopterin-guanine dinucleotide biosynthesis protein B [Candidatus Bipolaricaulota bacterium]